MSANNLWLGRVEVKNWIKQRNTKKKNMPTLGHMTCDQEKKRYVQQQPPKDAPLTVTIQVDSEEYLRHTPKLPLILNKRHCRWNGTKMIHDLTKPLPTISMAADTGAQVDTVGPQHLAKLGLDKEGLLRSSVGLYCADNMKAHYLGVFLAKITGTSETTKQSKTVHTMVYVIKGANCLMSRSTLLGLGCLPKSFPEIGKYDEDNAQVIYVATDHQKNTTRRNPDSLPTPMSELSGFQPEGRDTPIPTQSPHSVY